MKKFIKTVSETIEFMLKYSLKTLLFLPLMCFLHCAAESFIWINKTELSWSETEGSPELINTKFINAGCQVSIVGIFGWVLFAKIVSL